jgi:Skp family chaperone for outer membrane proteins
MRHLLLLTALTAAALATPISAALAGGVAVVDFDEGRDAQTRLDTMFSTRRDELQRMQATFQTAYEDYEARGIVLSDAARADEERTLMTKQAELQQTAQTFETEMQSTYMTLLQDLDEKMRRLTETIAAEHEYDVVLDRAAVVYVGGGATDMTDELITRYNAL